MLQSVFLFSFAYFSVLASAEKGGSTGVGRGGDPRKKISSQWDPFLERPTTQSVFGPWFVNDNLIRNLKPSLIVYLRNRGDFRHWKDSNTADIMRFLIREGLIQDIRFASYYNESGACSLGEASVAGRANDRDFGGAICLSPDFFERGEWGPMATWAILAGLAIHEHAHHFGVEDEDHALMLAVASDFSVFMKEQRITYSPLLHRFFSKTLPHDPELKLSPF